MTDEQRTQFDYLLNAFVAAREADKPAEHGYAAKRKALYAYVRDLEQRASQQQPQASCLPPAGFALVPIKPTPAMLDAGAMRVAMNMQYVGTAESEAAAIWRDMIAAAPQSGETEA